MAWWVTFSSLLAMVIVAAHGEASAAPVRVSFDYGWRFSRGDPAATPPLTTASLDPTFTTDVSNMTCAQLAWSQLGRMGITDCRGACSATPGCLMWQFVFPRVGCFIHDGTLGNAPSCTATPVTPAVGASRSVVPPPVQQRKGVTWADPTFDDSHWSAVDAPHDFILLVSLATMHITPEQLY
jgi:hypothetical protein